jgi:hypothetical protein
MMQRLRKALEEIQHQGDCGCPPGD